MSKFAILWAKGDQAFRHDHLLQAIAHYTEALKIEPANEDVLGCRSAVYSKMGMFNEAKKDAERLIASVPNKPKGYFLRAAALESLCNYNESLYAFLKAYELDSRHPLELVLNIVHVAGCVCQLSEDEEINLSNAEGENEKIKKLVQIGKRLFQSKEHNLCIAVLSTALRSHYNLNETSADNEDDSNTIKGAASFLKSSEDTSDSLGSYGTNSSVTPSLNLQFPSMYLTTGFHGDLNDTKWDGVNRASLQVVDSSVLMSALLTMSQACFAMRQYPQALKHSKQCLTLAFDCENREYELKAYVKLANIYQRLGDYLQAISYNGKLLAVGRDLEKVSSAPSDYERYWNSDEERKAIWNLSAAYKSLGDYKKALMYAREYMEVLKCIDQENVMQTDAYANMGELELLLGGHETALECHQMELRLSKKFNDKCTMAYAYGNTGKVYAAMGNYKLSEVNHLQHLKLAQSLGDRVSELVAIKQLGDMHKLMGEYTQALEYYETHLNQAKVNKLDDLQCKAYGLIGRCYWKLSQFHHAQHYFNRSLELACELGEKEEELESRHFLALIMKSLRQYEKCRQYYNEVIPVLEHRLYLKQGQNIVYDDPVADRLDRCYKDLQEVLIEMNYSQEALEISEHCKSRVLVSILRHQNIISKDTQGRSTTPDLSPCTADEIFSFVDNQGVTVLVYSVVDSGFLSWFLSPGKGIVKFFRYKNCEHMNLEDRIKSCIGQLNWGTDNCYKYDLRSLPGTECPAGSSKGSEGGEECTPKSCFACTFSNPNLTPLQKLYTILISPFEELLKTSDGDSKKVLLVPDGVLNMVPFPSLQTLQGSYLHQMSNISILPCIRLLSLKDKNEGHPGTGDNFTILVGGNPEIPNVQLDTKEWSPHGKSDLAEEEVTSIATLLGVIPVTGCQATKECILEMLSKSSVVHLVTYGSWSKGCLAFAPNPHSHGSLPSEDSYLVSVPDLVAIKMTAKVVVISSCCSCSHKYCYMRQANYNLATALLAAGTQTVIMPLWSLQQPALLMMFYHFYSSLEKGKTVSDSLKEAWFRVRSLHQFVDPVSWASHIMLGFDTTVNLPKLRHRLFDKVLDREVNGVVSQRFGVKSPDFLESTVPSGSEKVDKFKDLLTSLMLQHGSLPRVLPSIRDLVKLANSMLDAYEKGQSLEKIVMCAQLSSDILDAPHTEELLVFMAFNFQKDGARERDPFVVFPHWDYDNTLNLTTQILDAVCAIFDTSGLAGHSLARAMKTLTKSHMEKLKEILGITTKYPARIVKTSDFVVRSLWYNRDMQRFLVSLGFYEVGQSLLFNKSDDNQMLIQAALKIVTGLLGYSEMNQARIRSSLRELTSEDSRRVKLSSLSPLITASKQIVMGTPWMSKHAQADEAQLKIKFAKELESINKDFGRVVTKSNYWHAQLLRTQSSPSPSLPVIGRSSNATSCDNPPVSSHRTKVKVVSGLTPSCNRRLAEEEPRLSISESRERRNAIYTVYAQRYDEITTRKRDEVRQLFMSHAEETR